MMKVKFNSGLIIYPERIEHNIKSMISISVT